MTDRPTLFAQWAASYDVDVRDADFPFLGYDAVLDTIAEQADAERLVQRDCHVVGADFAPAMLHQTAEKLPGVALVALDLTSDDWTALAGERFDRIVAAYVFHEFPLDDAVALLRRLATAHLAPAGSIVFGDIAFPTMALRAEAQRVWASVWDADEHYWAADEALPALEAAGFVAAYQQVSACAGVFRLVPVANA